MNTLLRIRKINAVSPSLGETLRSCMLRAGLSQSPEAKSYVLGNPKAWLGTAYHAALEAVDGDDKDIAETVQNAWDKSIQALYNKAKNHNLDRRFNEPETWPGYHLIFAMAQVRAAEQWKDAPAGQHAGSPSNRKPVKEHKFSAYGGKLVGSPDLVRDKEVIDFKSGQIFEDENTEIIKEHFLRQLRIYGFLVYENLGWWPERGILLPMNGSRVEVLLDPEECKREAQEAVELLLSYNQSCASASSPAELANAAAETCNWCPYQSICPFYWDAIKDDWATITNYGSIEGTLTEAPRQIHNGLAYSLSLLVERASAHVGEVKTLFPFDCSLYPEVKMLQPQERVRLTGLVRRTDGSFTLGKRTVLAKVEDTPGIVVEATLDGPA